MKPKNFPARKVARQIAAQNGGSRKLYDGTYDHTAPAVQHALTIRTKKNRSSVRY